MRQGTLLCLLLLTACGGASRREMTAALASAVAVEKPPAYARGVSWQTLRAIYADRRGEPLWVSPTRPMPRARELVDVVANAESEGLRIGEYDLAGLQSALERAYGKGKNSPADLAELDVRFTALYLAYGLDLLAGRLDPTRVDKDWFIRTRRSTADSTLRVAARAENFDETLKALAPGQADYAALVRELKRYRAIAAAGGWPAVTAPVKAGASGPPVAALRRRLALSGDLDSSSVAVETLDAGLAEAVARFRARHGLPSEGGLDRAAAAALNVPVEQRIRQLELNLERLRWLPNNLGDRYVFVNVPDFELHAFDGGKEVLGMRVIVGEEYDRETPVFADTMSYVEFRPYWNVPRGIALNEIVPKVRGNERFLAANNYEVVPESGKDEPIDPGSIDWGDVDSTNFPYRIRQAPGPGNALGQVKFMFPNRFDIYMHDTPAEHLFHEHRRAFSHGCIRLQHPDQFARYVLDGVPEWTPDRIREAMDADGSQQVKVRKTLPVYILYLTAFVKDGVVQYRDDLYGTDRQAMARLGKPASPAVIASLRERLGELMKG